MDSLKHFIENRPATFTLLITSLSVGLLLIAKTFEPDPTPLFNLPRLSLLVLISFSVIALLNLLNWQQEASLTSPISSWRGRWFLTPLPMLLIAFLSFTSANLADAQYSAVNLFAWILSNFAGSFFEEVLMRGLCFLILLKAWGSNRRGVFMAAFFQAALFGLAHLGNLYHMPTIDVVAQVIFATLIGFGFAGLVYLSKSLWPAIIVHSAINLSGTFNDFMLPGGADFQSPGVSGYMVIIALFFVLSTLPGLLYLRYGTSHLATVNQ